MVETIRVEVVLGDITLQDMDAIVNAANKSLLGGGGVDGAIHRAAGPGLLAECRLLNGCPTGEAKLTRGYNLKARFVIHTPGPVWRGGGHGEESLLASCWQKCLQLACDQGLKSIAFPSIATGVYAFPVEKAARIAAETVTVFMRGHALPERVRVVAFDERTLRCYRDAFGLR